MSVGRIFVQSMVHGSHDKEHDLLDSLDLEVVDRSWNDDGEESRHIADLEENNQLEMGHRKKDTAGVASSHAQVI